AAGSGGARMAGGAACAPGSLGRFGATVVASGPCGRPHRRRAGGGPVRGTARGSRRGAPAAPPGVRGRGRSRGAPPNGGAGGHGLRASPVSRGGAGHRRRFPRPPARRRDRGGDPRRRGPAAGSAGPVRRVRRAADPVRPPEPCLPAAIAGPGPHPDRGRSGGNHPAGSNRPPGKGRRAAPRVADRNGSRGRQVDAGGVAATITVNWIDWLTLATVLVSVLRGTRYGVLAGVLDLLALIGAFLAASALYAYVVPSLHKALFLPAEWGGFLAFVVIWLALYIAVGVLIR